MFIIKFKDGLYNKIKEFVSLTEAIEYFDLVKINFIYGTLSDDHGRSLKIWRKNKYRGSN